MAAFRAFVLVGPTAVGKTGVAHCIAARRGGAIISADSMMVYRGMDVGTAKPTAAEREAFRYAGIDLADPEAEFSAGLYRDAVARDLELRPPRDRPDIVVGGTGLYLRALLGDLTVSPADPEIRRRVEAMWTEGGLPALHTELRRVDAARIARLADPKNQRRVMRALELALGGQPVDARESRRPRVVGLRMDIAQLRQRIARRAAAMFDAGLLDEAASLRARYPRLSRTASGAIGYAEAFAVLDGTLGIAGAIERTARRTAQLARRQMTWFRNRENVAWVDVTDGEPVDRIAERVEQAWEHDGPVDFHF